VSILQNFVLTANHIRLHKDISRRGIGRSCNDLLPEELSLLSKDQWIEFSIAHHKWNGDLEEFNPLRIVLLDFMVIEFLNAVLYLRAENFEQLKDELEIIEHARQGWAHDAVEAQKEIEKLKKQNEILVEALKYYANRMGSGGTARQALKDIKQLKQGEGEGS
jgi:hypothetical protein